jgi:hypothetical protein
LLNIVGQRRCASKLLTSLKDMAKKLEAREGNPYAFPEMGWGVSNKNLYHRYTVAMRGLYNPLTSIDWDFADPERFNDEERVAVRYYMSRQAFFEYGLVLNILRALQECITKGYQPEITRLLLMHLRDEWAHTEMPSEYAKRLGGVMRPLGGVLEKSRRDYQMKSKSMGVKIQRYYTSLSWGEMASGFAWYGPLREVRDPVARQIFSYIYVDEMRHSRSNLEWASADLTEDDKKWLEDFVLLDKKQLFEFRGFGYSALPKEEREFHVECMKIAKDVGIILWDADEFLDRLRVELKNNQKVLDDLGIPVDFSKLEREI